jgi:hypothetical protein
MGEPVSVDKIDLNPASHRTQSRANQGQPNDFNQMMNNNYQEMMKMMMDNGEDSDSMGTELSDLPRHSAQSKARKKEDKL